MFHFNQCFLCSIKPVFLGLETYVFLHLGVVKQRYMYVMLHFSFFLENLLKMWLIINNVLKLLFISSVSHVSEADLELALS